VLAAVMNFAPHYLPPSKPNHVARAVQPNFPEVQAFPTDWFRLHAGDLESLERLSLAPAARKPDLLIWPETPAPFSQQDPEFAKIASRLAIKFGHSFLAGAIEWKTPVDPAERGEHPRLVPYNSALLFDPQGQRVFAYDKNHLVPFGEYEPFPLIHRVVSSVSDEVGGFHKGQSYAVGKLTDGNRFGVFICYEAIFPDEVRRFAAGGAQLLINISNDGWFGRSEAPEQHLQNVRVRAVENRRWIVRATNNGYTVSIDPYGRIYAPIPPDVRAAADLRYDFRSDETFYTRFGDWFAWFCVLVSVILLIPTFRKANRAPNSLAS
jgi:apolipoprotein N-acyltransferase